ncbi:DUF4397 domain-containing protein [Ideonella sp. BN130291]|uniref:DUF4397 domain-containing protein n=1 Tax=Ideonella sp. BN130291 TaxID=3112940 RepID=UPI002E2558AD|nr:DUF4397 domain-containing protein [Ideonella sp. BN130291]
MTIFGARSLWRAGAACLAAALVAGCGGSGSDDSGTASLRVVNASPGYGQLDFYVDDSIALSSIASGTATSYISLSSGTAHSTLFTRTGSATTVQSQDRTLSADVAYTVVAYGWEGSLKTFHLSEDESAPDSGKAKLRTVNTAPDAGTLDVYVTGVTDSLTDVSPVNSSVAGNSLSAFSTLTQGTYRIRVTAAGSKTDVRLDIPSVTLDSQEVASLIVTPTTGGVLVNALVLPQKGQLESYTNTYGRARLVAAVSGNAGVAAAAGSTTLSSGSRSPLVGNYTLVPTGLLPLTVSVNGTAVSAGNATVAPGAELTLLVHGDPGAAQVTLLSDDNRLPSQVTGLSSQARVRLVHAVAGLASGVSLVADFSALADDVAYGTASSYVSLSAGTLSQVDVTSPLQASALFSATDVTLQSEGVYTLFMMGGASAPAGVLRKDR